MDERASTINLKTFKAIYLFFIANKPNRVLQKLTNCTGSKLKITLQLNFVCV